MTRRVAFGVAVPAWTAVLFLVAGRPSASAGEAPIRFNRDIRPILAEMCIACHGPDSASRKADLRLDRRQSALAAGAIVPGKPGESELVARITSDDPQEIMPPPAAHKTLSNVQRNLLVRWIKSGAEYEPHWSFITPARPALPAVKNAAWCRTPIDRFVLARLEEAGLAPAAEADRRTLARRLSLDITGLPPDPAEVAAFVNDSAPDAYEKLVARWMALPQWGEHRGRYWLDAARYADTHGLHFDNFREMWSYRDWVIDAFNRNLPFDRFTIEQLAGDLLPKRTLEQQIATGFNRCNITTNEGGTIPEENLVLYTRDRTETTSQVWLGITANCAVCHDHKFDPLSQKEFYSLAAFFNNTTQGALDGNIKDTPPILVVPLPEDRKRWDELTQQLEVARRNLDQRRQTARRDFDAWKPQAGEIAAALPANGLHVEATLSREGTLACGPACPCQDEKAAATKCPDGTCPAEKCPDGKCLLENTAAAKCPDGKCPTAQPAAAPAAAPVTVTIDGIPCALPAAKTPAWVPGHVAEQALQITPETLVQLPAAGDIEKDQPITVTAWIKIPKESGSGAIVARMNEKDGYRGWDCWIENRRLGMHVIHKFPEDALKTVTKNQVPPDVWLHVAFLYDGSAKAKGVRVFVNGKAEEMRPATDKLKSTIRTDAPLTIGRRSPGTPLKGLAVHDLRLYRRALSVDEIESLRTGSRAMFVAGRPAAKRTPAEKNELYEFWLRHLDKPYREAAAGIAALEKEQAPIKARGTIAHVMAERPEPAKAFVLFRGEYDKRRDEVSPGTPACLPPMPADLPRNRLGLAQWLLRPENPLCARVTVNRFWQELFGQGLVRTAGDFGATGEAPSHPELLDWLAVEFRESGWDVKKFYRLLFLSATYRQAAQVTPQKLEKDPYNRLLSRGPRFRMDAEMLRDCALAASGVLSNRVGGPSVRPYQPEGVWEAVAMIGSNTRNYTRDGPEGLYRRSMYTFWKRAAPPASMEILNAPSRETCCVRRERTDTPLQALVTLNDPQFIEAARQLAARVLREGGSTDPDRVEYLAGRILSRPFSAGEMPIVLASLKSLVAWYTAHADDAQALLAVGETKPDDKLDPRQLAGWTMLVNQLMNLDEALNK